MVNTIRCNGDAPVFQCIANWCGNVCICENGCTIVAKRGFFNGYMLRRPRGRSTP